MKIQPINGHVLIRPVEEKTAYVSSQSTYEERGEVLDVAPPITREAIVGRFAYFDSWAAAKYKDGEGNEFWVVPFEKIRAIEA